MFAFFSFFSVLRKGGHEGTVSVEWNLESFNRNIQNANQTFSQTVGNLIFAPRETEKEVTIQVYVVIKYLREVKRHWGHRTRQRRLKTLKKNKLALDTSTGLIPGTLLMTENKHLSLWYNLNKGNAEVYQNAIKYLRWSFLQK